MNTVNNIINWGDEHYKPWMAPFRMFFGLFIVAKGLYFIDNSDYVLKWFHTMNFMDILGTISMLFAFLHVFLGCLILIGFATRFSCTVMIPIIIASVFFSNPHLNNLLQFLFTVISILLCVFFIAEGSGRFSVYYFFSHSNETEPDKLAKQVGEVK